MANKKFVVMCQGITGQIGELIVDDNHERNVDGITIDLLIVDITNGLDVELEEQVSAM